MSGQQVRVLAEEQAALRRVATLVARGVSPEDVFAAVTEEVGRLFPVSNAAISAIPFSSICCALCSLGSCAAKLARTRSQRSPSRSFVNIRRVTR